MPIISLPFYCVMSRTIKFYYKLYFCAIKICNIPSENLLTGKFDWICIQKIIPKAFFFVGHVLAKHFGNRGKVFVVLARQLFVLHCLDNGQLLVVTRNAGALVFVKLDVGFCKPIEQA